MMTDTLCVTVGRSPYGTTVVRVVDASTWRVVHTIAVADEGDDDPRNPTLRQATAMAHRWIEARRAAQ